MSKLSRSCGQSVIKFLLDREKELLKVLLEVYMDTEWAISDSVVVLDLIYPAGNPKGQRV